MPREIVINRRYGGFCLSQKAKDMYRDATKDTPIGKDFYIDSDIPRDDPDLIRIIRQLGLKESAGHFASLRIVKIPDDVPADGWIIQDYDGIEWVAEKHRTWSNDDDDDEQAQPSTIISSPRAGESTVTTDTTIVSILNRSTFLPLEGENHE